MNHDGKSLEIKYCLIFNTALKSMYMVKSLCYKTSAKLIFSKSPQSKCAIVEYQLEMLGHKQPYISIANDS